MSPKGATGGGANWSHKGATGCRVKSVAPFVEPVGQVLQTSSQQFLIPAIDFVPMMQSCTTIIVHCIQMAFGEASADCLVCSGNNII